ncbi:MAG: GYD domain-containing protein [Pseudomonadota bacterium]
MASYIMLSTLTDEGRKTLKQRPERLQEVNKEVEAMGARVTSQYAVLGGYDFVNVIEAPSNEVMARISMELGSRGTIKITTLPCMAISQFVEMMQQSPPKSGDGSGEDAG